MIIGDKYTDAGGATRIITDLVNMGPSGPEEVGYRIDGVPAQRQEITVNGEKVIEFAFPKHFQKLETFQAETAPAT